MVFFRFYNRTRIGSDSRVVNPSEVKRGNKGCQFHSELAATEDTGGDYRVGVGVSRTAEVLLEAPAQISLSIWRLGR